MVLIPEQPKKKRKPGSGGARPGSGKPKSVIDWAMLERACEIQPTRKEIALLAGVSEPTLEKHLAERGYTWPTFFEEHRQGGMWSLRRAQWNNATEHNNTTMQIWLGKQHLGQKDEATVNHAGSVEISRPEDQAALDHLKRKILLEDKKSVTKEVTIN